MVPTIPGQKLKKYKGPMVCTRLYLCTKSMEYRGKVVAIFAIFPQSSQIRSNTRIIDILLTNKFHFVGILNSRENTKKSLELGLKVSEMNDLKSHFMRADTLTTKNGSRRLWKNHGLI